MDTPDDRPGVALELRDVRFAYRGPDGEPRDVLRGVDLDVSPGERLAVLGRIHRGRDVLLRMIAGRPPGPGWSAGSIRIDGEELGVGTGSPTPGVAWLRGPVQEPVPGRGWLHAHEREPEAVILGRALAETRAAVADRDVRILLVGEWLDYVLMSGPATIPPAIREGFHGAIFGSRSRSQTRLIFSHTREIALMCDRAIVLDQGRVERSVPIDAAAAVEALLADPTLWHGSR